MSNSCWRPTKRVSPAGDSGLQARAHRSGAKQLKGVHRLCQSLDPHRAERLDLDIPLGQPQDIGGQQDRPGHGRLFHARRQVDGLADGGIVHVQVAANRAHHHFAGMQANAYLDGGALRALHSTAYCCTNSCMRRAA